MRLKFYVVAPLAMAPLRTEVDLIVSPIWITMAGLHSRHHILLSLCRTHEVIYQYGFLQQSGCRNVPVTSWCSERHTH
jgi:hypothetical protein